MNRTFGPALAGVLALTLWWFTGAALASASPSKAESLVDQGIKALKRNDPAGARQLYEQAAVLGDADAMYRLGDLYQNGKGVEPDVSVALRWYTEAAQRGSAEAIASIGWMLQEGKGVTRNEPAAREWLEAAAVRGNAYAMNVLGDIYLDGLGVPVDKAMGARWMQASADRGRAWAMVTLGNLYIAGDGMKADACRGVDWYRRALKLEPDNSYALRGMAFAYLDGHCVAASQVEARKWFKLSADKGDDLARQKLAELDAPPVVTHNGYGEHGSSGCDQRCTNELVIDAQIRRNNRMNRPVYRPAPLPPAIYVRPISPFYGSRHW